MTTTFTLPRRPGRRQIDAIVYAADLAGADLMIEGRMVYVESSPRRFVGALAQIVEVADDNLADPYNDPETRAEYRSEGMAAQRVLERLLTDVQPGGLAGIGEDSPTQPDGGYAKVIEHRLAHAYGLDA